MGFDKERLIESIDSIRKEIDDKKDCVDNASFDMGLPGIALFYYYYFAHTNNAYYKEKALDCIKTSVSMLSKTSYGHEAIKYRTDSLDNHLSGFGRVLIFIQDNFDNSLDIEELLLTLDDILYDLLYSKIEVGDYDIDSGVLASAYYFLARYKHLGFESNHRIKKIFEDIVDSLDESKNILNPEQIYWKSPSLNNRIYLGLSHGSSMMINFLSKMVSLDISTEKAKDMIIKSVNFLNSQKRNQVNGLFPNCFPDEETEPTQFSQCYGDLGVGYSMYIAAKTLNDDKLLEESIAVLDACSLRRKEDNLTQDASIIYGASGVALLLDRLSQMSGVNKFKTAAQYWFESITGYKNENTEFAGYSSMFSNVNDANWGLSFGWGIAGIGVTLIKYVNPHLQNFDDLLMIGPSLE